MHEYETKTVQHYTMYLRVYEEQTYLHVRTGRALIVEAQGKLSATIPSLNNEVLTLSLIKNQGLVDPKRLQRVHRIAGLGSVKRHHQQVHLGLCFTVFSMHACWCLRVCPCVSLAGCLFVSPSARLCAAGSFAACGLYPVVDLLSSKPLSKVDESTLAVKAHMQSCEQNSRGS